MHIVAGNAADPWVSSAKTLAVRQPVGLKPHVDLAPPSAADYGFPRPVALPTEIRDVFRDELSQVRRECVRKLALGSSDQVSA